MKIKLTLLLSTCCLVAYSQNERLRLFKGFEFGARHSFLTYNLKDVETRNSAELYAGCILDANITPNFYLSASGRLGLKIKAKYFSNFITEPDTYQYLNPIDETLSERSHVFLEVPVLVDFRKKSFRVGSGVLARHYINNGDERDFLSGHYEVGSYTRLGYHLTETLAINADAYFGLSPIFSGYFLNSPNVGATQFKARNNFLGLSVSYHLKSNL